MSLYINGSDQFFDIANETATTQTREVHHVSIIAAGVLTLTSLYLLLQPFLFWSRSLTDKAGNRIPVGPRGLPIVGQLHLLLIRYKSSTVRTCIDTNFRFIFLPDALSRAQA